MKRKLISSLLCLCMLFSLLPVAAFAGDEDGTDTTENQVVDQTTPASDESGETVEPQQETRDTTPTPSPAPAEVKPVIAANLHDNSVSNPISDDDLENGFTVSYGSETNTGGVKTIPVTVTHTGLRAHASLQGEDRVMGYWVGVGIPEVENASYIFGFGNVPTNYNATSNGPTYGGSTNEQTVGETTYKTFYFNATGAANRDKAYIVQKVTSGETTTYTIYTITLNITRKIELVDSLTGFYWKTTDKPQAVTDAGAISDWRPETMLFTFRDVIPQNEYLWAEITAPNNGGKYGIALEVTGDSAKKAAGSKYMAWSFLTQSQFEMWPSGKAVGAALGNYTVNIYEVPTSVAGGAGSVTARPTGAKLIATKTIPVTSPLPTATLGYTSVADTSIVSDCAAKTMYVRFANALPNNTYLWFEVTAPDGTTKYEIGANAKNTTTTKFAWSFTNQGQFEKWPDRVDVGKVTSGTYTVKAYLSPDEITGAHKTSGKPAGCVELWSKTVEVSDTTVVTPAATQPTLSDSIKETDKDTVTTAVSNINVESPATLANAAQDKANEAGKISEDTAKSALTSQNVTFTDKTVTVVVQPYLAVEAQAYDATNKTLTVNIDAMSRTIATTANVENEQIKVANDKNVTSGANAAQIGQATKLTVDDPIKLSIQLPDGFATLVDGKSDEYVDIFVKHTKNGKSHFHKAQVTKGTGTNASKQYATFVSTDGLSPFEIDASKTSGSLYSIGNDAYESLQDAINAVKGGEKITLGSGFAIGTNETVPPFTGTNKNFTIDKSATSLTTDGVNKLLAALKAGGAADATIKGDIITVTATVENTEPSNPDDNNNSSSGGGGASSSVSASSTSNGKVSVSNSNAKKGDTVTVTVTPNSGYVLDTLTVTDSKGNVVTTSKTDDTHYTFTMPEGRVTVKATFKQADVTPPPADTGFTDVAADAYYADAVKWAVDKGITNGLTATTFGPNNSCTRAQMVTFLWRGAGSPAPTGTNSFTDVASGEYYYNAVLWAVEKGITNGTTDTTFSPNATVNRAQTVTFLYRYAGSPAATGDNAFTDVAAGQYYTDAVKWAVAEEITNGTSATTFAPNNNCTRGQIVTFLYRQMAE